MTSVGTSPSNKSSIPPATAPAATTGAHPGHGDNGADADQFCLAAFATGVWGVIWGGMGPPGARRPHAGDAGAGYAVTACLWSLLVILMLRGLAASCTGMVRVSTPVL
jgi:hypothetical protein